MNRQNSGQCDASDLLNASGVPSLSHSQSRPPKQFPDSALQSVILQKTYRSKSANLLKSRFLLSAYCQLLDDTILASSMYRGRILNAGPTKQVLGSQKSHKRLKKVAWNFSMNYIRKKTLSFCRSEAEFEFDTETDTAAQTTELQRNKPQNKSFEIPPLRMIHQMGVLLDPRVGKPVPHLCSDDVWLDALFQNILIVGPPKRDLHRFLNNRDLTMEALSALEQPPIEVDKIHFDRLRKYLNPSPQKIGIEKIQNFPENFTAFLGNIAALGAIESFVIPLVTESMKNTIGFGLKQNIKRHKSKCPLLAESNPHGFVYYHVTRFDDFFIDASISAKLNGKFIEVYRFSRYLVFQSVYPLTQVFTILLEYLIMQYQKTRLERWAKTVQKQELTLQDYEN